MMYEIYNVARLRNRPSSAYIILCIMSGEDSEIRTRGGQNLPRSEKIKGRLSLIVLEERLESVVLLARDSSLSPSTMRLNTMHRKVGL